jgi:exopolysaccharide biosynthesis polyprenyl glycosylphosphotransferase
MFRRFGINYAIFSLILDFVTVALSLFLAAQFRPLMEWLPLGKPIGREMVALPLFVLVPILWTFILFLFSIYNTRAILKERDEFVVLLLSTAFSALATAGLLYLVFRYTSRWLFIIFVILAFILMFARRIIARMVFATKGWPEKYIRRVLVVGTNDLGRELGRMVQEHKWAAMSMVGYVTDSDSSEVPPAPVLGKVRDIRNIAIAHRVDEVVILPPHSENQVEEIVKSLLDIPLHVRVVPAILNLALDRAAVDEFAGIPMIDLRAGPLNEYQRLTKRIFDLVAGSALLVLLSLPMAIVAVAIKLDTTGPVLFKQKRVGENSRIFTMYKFRSMVHNAEQLQEQVNVHNSDGAIIHKSKNDFRVTRVGRFIRRTSLDELPQLINVLKGEMSLVGPRPELLWIVEQYQPWQRRRLVVPPGITGWWQVSGRSTRLMHLHTDDDIYYISNYSFWLDLRIIWRTLWTVLEGTGAH